MAIIMGLPQWRRRANGLLFLSLLLAIVAVTHGFSFSPLRPPLPTSAGSCSKNPFSIACRNGKTKNIAFTRTTTTTSSRRLAAATQSLILDGGEWNSLRGPDSRDRWGRVTAVVGTREARRVVGLKSPPGSSSNDSIMLDDGMACVEAKSVATIPTGISDEQALWTALLCLSRVHAVWPTLDNDAADGFYPHPDLWIIGSNEDAVGTANILATLGASVTMIAKNRPKLSLVRGVTFYNADDDVPFCEAFKSVDGVIDMLGEEGTNMIRKLRGDPWKCRHYVSLRTHSLGLVETNGVFGGPGKVQEYVKSLQSSNNAATAAPPNFAPAIGSTLDRMFATKCLFAKPKDYNKMVDGGVGSLSPYLRTWDLADFWESTTWPRQAMSNVRYGWPSDGVQESYDYDDDDEDDDDNDGMTMISAPPLTKTRKGGNDFLQNPVEASMAEDRKLSSPDVTWVADSLAVDTVIAQPRKTAVLFVSAPFCRTCRYLKPLYYRMAQQYKNRNDNDDGGNNGHSTTTVQVEFCQADASGPIGKVLSRKLDIDAVPSFLLFRNGERFGPPLSVTKIPSPKLDLAVSWILDANAKWDEAAMRAVEEKEKRRK
jgi:thiol-disulfide isomerase/thioredoxin